MFVKDIKDGRAYSRVSRWIKLEYIEVTTRHSLYDYTDVVERDGNKGWLYVFRHNGRLYALNQFAQLGFPVFYEENDKIQYISGYDITQWWKPFLIEIEEGGEHVRLYQEIT